MASLLLLDGVRGDVLDCRAACCGIEPCRWRDCKGDCCVGGPLVPESCRDRFVEEVLEFSVVDPLDWRVDDPRECIIGFCLEPSGLNSISASSSRAFPGTAIVETCVVILWGLSLLPLRNLGVFISKWKGRGGASGFLAAKNLFRAGRQAHIRPMVTSAVLYAVSKFLWNVSIAV